MRRYSNCRQYKYTRYLSANKKKRKKGSLKWRIDVKNNAQNNTSVQDEMADVLRSEAALKMLHGLCRFVYT